MLYQAGPMVALLVSIHERAWNVGTSAHGRKCERRPRKCCYHGDCSEHRGSDSLWRLYGREALRHRGNHRNDVEGCLLKLEGWRIGASAKRAGSPGVPEKRVEAGCAKMSRIKPNRIGAKMKWHNRRLSRADKCASESSFLPPKVIVKQ